MNKIVTYLNEHLTGEVSSNNRELSALSTDKSILLQRPEMVAHVADSEDVRKIARFCSQLAEKGHKLTITTRSGGQNTVGSAIGAGIIISLDKYMSNIIDLDPKQRLIHLQAGLSIKSTNATLSTHKNLTLTPVSFNGESGSVGGAIASAAAGRFNERFGDFQDNVKQVEVVLANGDILQTERLSKRELNARKGLHTMEGEIYRQLDDLICNNQDLIQQIAQNRGLNSANYEGIADVKGKDGSFDLTPLFCGSEGTLGIVTEAILECHFARDNFRVVLAAYKNLAEAQAALEVAMKSKATSVEFIDGRLLERVVAQGKTYDFDTSKAYKGGLVLAIFDEFSERTNSRYANKLVKQLQKLDNSIEITSDNYNKMEMAHIYSLLSLAENSADDNVDSPALFRNFWLPMERLDNFLMELHKIEIDSGVALPIHVDMRSGLISLFPLFDLQKITSRQKLVNLLISLSGILAKHNGNLAGSGGSGRIKSIATNRHLSKEMVEFYAEIKNIFDPLNILNAGVKQAADMQTVVGQLNSYCRASGSGR